MEEKQQELRFIKPKTDAGPTRVLYVAGVGHQFGSSAEAIKRVFEEFGELDQSVENGVDMVPDKRFCFVVYKQVDDATRAMAALNHQHVEALNAKVFIQFAVDAPEKKGLPEPECISSTADVQLEGLDVIEDFIDQATREQLWHFFTDPERSWEDTLSRRVQHYAFPFNYRTLMANYAVPAPEIPEICQPLMQRMVTEGLISGMPNQMTVNEYEPGQGIAPHVDNQACFGEEIQLLSLGSAVVMTFTSKQDSDVKKHVLLPPGSLALLRGPARHQWSHGISARKQDKVNGTLINRGLRISLTFRQVMVPGDLPSESLVETEIEDEHVVQVYDDIAPHWHHTRGRRKVYWYRVKDYLEALEPGSLLADIGCGDGKYFGVNPDILSIGCDRSLNLLEVSKAPLHETFCCDAVKVPLRSGVFDACICIAVLHHLANLNRRVAVVRELARIVRTGGTVMLQAWAQEQEAGSKRTFEGQDVLVPWKFQPWHAEAPLKAAHATTDANGLVVYQRYCHVYKEGELEDLCSLVPNIRILESGYDRSNWFLLFQKIDDERLHNVAQAPPQTIEEKKLAVL